MLIFLYGSDSYRLKQAKEEVVKRYQAKFQSGMNLFTADLSESSGQDIFEDALKSSSFFNEHKLIVCKNVFDKKASAEFMATKIKEFDLPGIADATVIIAENLTEKDMNAKHKDLFKALNNEKSKVQAVEGLEGEKLSEWIRSEVKSRGAAIEPSAVKSLVEIVGKDSWALINEIEKLANYSEVIKASDVAVLVNARQDLNIFNLTDSIGAKNTKKTLELLYKELNSGRDPYYILTMMIYQLRNTLIVKDLQGRGLSEFEIARKAKLNPFVVGKIARNSFELSRAKNIYSRLLDLDTGFKMGRLNLENSLYNIILV